MKSKPLGVGVSHFLSPLDHLRTSAPKALLRPALVSINFHPGVLVSIVSIEQQDKENEARRDAHPWLPSLVSSTFTSPWKIPRLAGSAEKDVPDLSHKHQMYFSFHSVIMTIAIYLVGVLVILSYSSH